MPTTIDRFFVVVQIAQNLSTMQNNMRSNIQVLRASLVAGTITLPQAQQGFRDLGTAFQQRLAFNANVLVAFPAQLAAGAAAVGIAPADITNVQALLVAGATTLQNATFATLADVDTLIINLLAAVPPAIQAF